MPEILVIMIALLAALYGTIQGLLLHGPFMFTYFTTLSNVLVIIYMCIALKEYFDKKKSRPVKNSTGKSALKFIILYI